jgi:hypothetical protein
MNLTITFNWPPDLAHISVGLPNIKDKEWEFRIGVIPKDKEDKIYWIKPGWFPGETKEQITFCVRRNDKVVVERKKRGANKAETRNTWDINEKWPAEAHDLSITYVPWYF